MLSMLAMNARWHRHLYALGTALVVACVGPERATALSLPPLPDLRAERSELFSKFPVLRDTNSLSSIQEFRQHLENFRRGDIEGWRLYTLEVCEKLNLAERMANRQLNAGDITRSEHTAFMIEVDTERDRCQARTGPYFLIYDDLMRRYRQQAATSFDLLNECHRRLACKNN